MPSVSQAQQKAMAIAEHSPSKLYKRNRSLLQMGRKQLHEFAATKRAGLPEHAPSAKRDNAKRLAAARKSRKQSGGAPQRGFSARLSAMGGAA